MHKINLFNILLEHCTLIKELALTDVTTRRPVDIAYPEFMNRLVGLFKKLNRLRRLDLTSSVSQGKHD